MAATTLDDRVELAIADLHLQDKPNYRGAAKKYELVESTLRRRFKGQHLSRIAAASEYSRNLTFIQEKALIRIINILTDCELPPNRSRVKELAEDMIERPVGKNWVGDFMKRHKDRLPSSSIRAPRSNAIFTQPGNGRSAKVRAI